MTSSSAATATDQDTPLGWDAHGGTIGGTDSAFSAAAAIIRVVGSAAVLSRIHALGLDSKRKERLVQLAQAPAS